MQPQCSLVFGVQAVDRTAKRDPEHLGALGIKKSSLLLTPNRVSTLELDRCGPLLSEPSGIVVALAQDAMGSSYRCDLQPSSQTPTPLISVDRRSTAFSNEHDLEGLGVRLVSECRRQLHARERCPNRSAVATNEELSGSVDACTACGGQEQIVGVFWGRRGLAEALRKRVE